jgi:hypothetical protein
MRFDPAPTTLAVALLAAMACRAPPPERTAAPSPPQVEQPAWTARSHDRSIEARQAGQAGACTLTVAGPGRPGWSAAVCAATGADRVFVSPDGERLLVVTPLPEHQGPDWTEAVVVTLLQRGIAARRVAAGELLGPALAADLSRHYSWLRGLELGSDPDAGARYAPGGAAVELETVAGRVFTVAFDGAGLPPPPTAEALASAARERLDLERATRDAADRRLYRWEDAEGAVHFGRIARIPQSLRARAVPVEGEDGR